MAKNGLLIAREFRLFREQYRYALVADSWAGLVTAAFNHEVWPLLTITSSNAPERKASLLVLAD